MIGRVTLMLSLLWIGGGGPARAAEEQPDDVRESLLLMRQDMQHMSKAMASIQQMLEALPKLYVPRAEHDLRDRNLDRSSDLARIDERMRYVERAQHELENRTQGWMWDVIKVLAGIAFGGAGALTWLRTSVARPYSFEPAGRRPGAEAAMPAAKATEYKTREALHGAGAIGREAVAPADGGDRP